MQRRPSPKLRPQAAAAVDLLEWQEHLVLERPVIAAEAVVRVQLAVTVQTQTLVLVVLAQRTQLLVLL